MSKSPSLPTTIWFCGQQTSQVQRKGLYTPESNIHPAKMLPELCRQIIQRYTSPGDTILDPFGGIGTTLVEGVHLGRNVTLVECEQKFVKLAESNAGLAVSDGATRAFSILRGDSRNLLALFASPVDQVVSSPPYGDTRLSVEPGILDRLGRALRAGKITEEQYRRFATRKFFTRVQPFSRYSDQPDNIGNRLYRTPESAPVRSTFSESYQEAVRKVYEGCFSLLKPGGFMVLVTRNFRRRGCLIDLAGDTVRVMEHIGFSFYQHNIAVLGSVRTDEAHQPYLIARSSFWQILQTRRANQRREPFNLVQHEDVLVFRKPVEQSGQRKKRR